MKTGKSLVDLATEIQRRAENKKDVIVNTKNMTMDAGQHMLIGGQLDLEVNEIAHNQIGEHVGIPAKYYDRMRAEAPDLLAANVNRWFAQKPENRMVRTLDGKMRSLLSDRYRALENEDLAEAVLPVIGDLGLDIMSAEITDRRLYIKCVDKKVTRELAKAGAHFGDGGHTIVRVTSPAITISNSEVGMGALSILAGIYDDFCSNLATFRERSVRKYHVGARHDLVGENIVHMLSDETRQKTDVALWAQIRDVVKGAFDRTRFDELCDRIEDTKKDEIAGDVVKVVNLATKKLGLNETEGASVLEHLIKGADLSRFGLYNAVTRAAQDVPSYDRATELEAIGANVIELPRSEWQEVLKQAA